MEIVRSFVAVELEHEIRRRLSRAQETLAGTGAEVKWVGQGNIHLTLRFLGELPPDRLDRVKAGLASIRCAPFPMRISGLGRFPPEGNRVSVLWAGCEGDPRLKKLWERVQASASEAGLPRDDHGFSPHVTLGRVRSGRNIRELLDALRSATEDFGEQNVDRFVLMRSELQPEGPRYSPLETYPLRPD